MTIANRLTLSRIIAVPVVLAVYYLPFAWARIAAAFLFVLASVTDLLDGKIARKRGEVTSFGKFTDPIADKLLVISMLMALCGSGKLHAMIAFAVIAREIIVSGVRLVAATSPKKLVIAASWLGKLKTNVQIVTVVLLLIDNWPFSYVGIPMAAIGVWLMLIVTIWSGLDYVVKYWPVIGESK